MLHVDKMFGHLSDMLLWRNDSNNNIKHSWTIIKNKELMAKEWPGCPLPPGVKCMNEKEPTQSVGWIGNDHTHYLPENQKIKLFF